MRPCSVILLAVILCISGCASIPLSTMISMSSMSPRSLVQVEPAQVRIRISVPQGFEVSVPTTHLTFVVDNSSVSHSSQLDLRTLNVMDDERPGGFLVSDLPVTTYLLALTPKGQAEFRSLQQVLLGMEHGTMQAGCEINFSKRPTGAQEVTFWVDIKLSDSESFMPLLDGAEVSFGDT